MKRLSSLPKSKHQVAPGHPWPDSRDKIMNDITKQTIARRAVEAAIWGMPIVSVLTNRPVDV
jgi:hypothetical protein